MKLLEKKGYINTSPIISHYVATSVIMYVCGCNRKFLQYLCSIILYE